MVDWLSCSGPVVRRNIMVGSVWSKAAHLRAAGKQRESQRKEHGPTVSLKGMSLMT